MEEDQDDREAASLARSAEILANEPTEAEIAEQAERARANKLERIMSPAAAPAPPDIIRKTNSDALRNPDGEFVSRKWVVGQLDNLARATGASLGKFAKDKIAKLQQEIEQGRKASEAIGRVVDRLSNELSELKREAALAKRLAEQNIKRKSDLLELENSILRAGRSPADARDLAEDELPKFSEWRHAQ